MKKILLVASLLIFGTGQAQEKPASEIISKTEESHLDKQATFSLNGQVYSFTPEVNTIRIKKLENKEELDFGQLRKTTDDGLYIMTSTMSEDVSFGRFDSLGNFRTMRYDQKTDSVLEEYYEKEKLQTQLSSKK